MNKLNSWSMSPILYGKFAVIEKMIYVSSMNYNGLFSIDMDTGKLVPVGKFIHQGNYNTLLFEVKNYGKKLVFSPSYAQEIAIFDNETRQIKEIPIKQVLNTSHGVTGAAAICRDNLYIFPSRSDSVIIYDLKNENMLDVINIADIYKTVFREEYTIMCDTVSDYICEDKIHIPCWIQPAVLSFDIEHTVVKFHKISGCTKGFSAICGSGGSVYLLNRNGEFIEWDASSHKIIDRFPVFADEREAEFYKMATIIDESVFFTSHGGILRIVKVDVKTRSVSRGLSKGIFDALGKQNVNETIYFGCIQEEKIYCYTEKNRYLCIDLKEDKLEWVKNIIFDFEEVKNFVFNEEEILEKNNIINETKVISIEEYVEIIEKKCRR